MNSYMYKILAITPGLIIPFIFGFGLCYVAVIENTYFSIIMYATIYTVIYSLSVYFISMNSYEKNLVKKIISKVMIIRA